MFPDPITPRSFPEKLEQVDYDPFGLMPKGFGARPRLFTTPAKLKITRGLIEKGGWPRQAFDLLLARAAEPCPFPAATPPAASFPLAQQTALYALRNAYAAALTGDAACRERGLETLRRLARAYISWPIVPGLGRLVVEDIQEGMVMYLAASAYDCLAASPLSPADERLFLDMLEATRPVSNSGHHSFCGNHHAAVLRGKLAVASAMGNREDIHDALYGCHQNGQWSYGIIHQLRHDFLSDGLHWERSPGYHFFMLSVVADMADIMENLGVDLWHAKLPPLMQDDGHDLHRAYGPTKGFKTLEAAFDAPLYFAFPNGDLSMLADSRLANLRGLCIWGAIYDLAYEAYKSPHLAWLLNRAERDYPQDKRTVPGLPMALQTPWMAELALARFRRAAYPAGRMDWKRDRPLSLLGRHVGGSTLFPVYGEAILRANPDKPEASAAALFWGPHTAGHQSPAALHADFYGAGRSATDAPRMDNRGYQDPLYLTWARTTIAHNTVTVDQKGMFPYDFDTTALWECDRWRDTISDGELVLFQPDGQGFKAVRARNENVYKDVLLDRTLVTTDTFILDVYRVTADRVRLFDWAMHVAGTPGLPSGSRTAKLGGERGYRHFSVVKRLPVSGKSFELTWREPAGITSVTAVLPPGCMALSGRDPIPEADKMHTLGEIGPVAPRHTLILRTRGKSALFVSAWSFNGQPVPLRLVKGAAETDVIVKTGTGKAARNWTLPVNAEPVQG